MSNVGLSLSDNLQLTQFPNDIGSAGRRNAQPVRETRSRDGKILLAVPCGSSSKSTDNEEVLALVLTGKIIERLLFDRRKRRYDLLAHSGPTRCEFA